MFRRALAGIAVLLAVACSDGSEPDLPEVGSFEASLRGARSGQLSGSANTGSAGTELGDFYAIRMFATPSDGTVSFVSLICPFSVPIAVGTYQFGPGQLCEARYGMAASDGFSVIELALAESGSMTVSVSNDEEIDGRFRFQGPLVRDADTVGVVSASGSFRATQL